MLTILIGLALQAAQSAPADPLPWMVGDWHCRGAPAAAGAASRFEEYWVADGRGGLVGVGRVSREATRALEHMRIAPDGEGRLAFFGSPNGAAPVAFTLVRAGDGEAVFENPAHDFPQRIAYRHEADALVATVSRIDGSDAQTWRYRRAGGEEDAACEAAEE